jgi:hypothetical protein
MKKLAVNYVIRYSTYSVNRHRRYMKPTVLMVVVARIL